MRASLSHAALSLTRAVDVHLGGRRLGSDPIDLMQHVQTTWPAWSARSRDPVHAESLDRDDAREGRPRIDEVVRACGRSTLEGLHRHQRDGRRRRRAITLATLQSDPVRVRIRERRFRLTDLAAAAAAARGGGLLDRRGAASRRHLHRGCRCRAAARAVAARPGRAADSRDRRENGSRLQKELQHDEERHHEGARGPGRTGGHHPHSYGRSRPMVVANR